MRWMPDGVRRGRGRTSSPTRRAVLAGRSGRATARPARTAAARQPYGAPRRPATGAADPTGGADDGRRPAIRRHAGPDRPTSRSAAAWSSATSRTWSSPSRRPGTFMAFTAVCTHQGCIVGEVKDGTINCPCHGSKFKVADGSVAKDRPAGRCARSTSRWTAPTITHGLTTAGQASRRDARRRTGTRPRLRRVWSGLAGLPSWRSRWRCRRSSRRKPVRRASRRQRQRAEQVGLSRMNAVRNAASADAKISAAQPRMKPPAPADDRLGDHAEDHGDEHDEQQRPQVRRRARRGRRRRVSSAGPNSPARPGQLAQEPAPDRSALVCRAIHSVTAWLPKSRTSTAVAMTPAPVTVTTFGHGRHGTDDRCRPASPDRPTSSRPASVRQIVGSRSSRFPLARPPRPTASCSPPSRRAPSSGPPRSRARCPDPRRVCRTVLCRG